MEDEELMLRLFEVFLAGWEAHRSGKENPAAAFADYWAAFTAGDSEYIQ